MESGKTRSKLEVRNNHTLELPQSGDFLTINTCIAREAQMLD